MDADGYLGRITRNLELCPLRATRRRFLLPTILSTTGRCARLASRVCLRVLYPADRAAR